MDVSENRSVLLHFSCQLMRLKVEQTKRRGWNLSSALFGRLDTIVKTFGENAVLIEVKDIILMDFTSGLWKVLHFFQIYKEFQICKN